MICISEWINTSNLVKLEARLLLQHVCGIRHSQIITQSNRILTSSEYQILESLKKRRQNGEPMAYILGYKEFYGRNFKVNSDVLIPRDDTEILLEQALNLLPNNAVVWDLGTGSGILAISIKLEREDATVWASDISEAALEVARANAKNLNAKNINWTQGSWYQTVSQPEKHSVDMIIANPPYIASNDIHLSCGDLRYEPQNALTDFYDGLSDLKHIIKKAGYFLKNGASIWLEHGYNQACNVRELLSQTGFSQIQTIQDLAGLDRVSGGVWFNLP